LFIVEWTIDEGPLKSFCVLDIAYGIICLDSEPVLSGSVIVTGIPAVDRPEGNIFELIKSGDYVKVDATEGIIEISTK
jgi:predicted aconitase with swiveling domain